MKRTRLNQKGFTVIEILIATSIFAVIMVAALLMYDRSNKVFKAGVEAADVQQNTRVAFDKIVADLRMAGFDFDRDGVPTTANAYQQPDEQIEYIHHRAITVRANYDYNDNPTANDHGREYTTNPGTTGLESINFPVVTTGNDEIVTYALVSADSSKNTDSVTFYADVPDRKAHPESGGRSENLVTVSGVDLSGLNPPYTLERISLNPSTSSITPLIRYPIATNIFDMQFEYFEDQVGTDPLTDLSGTAIAAADYGSSVGGLGQYNPASSAALPAKLIRGKIQSIKLVLVGMTESPDPAYTDPNDTTIAPRHRKYRLESLIVPRNYGRRGFREQDYIEPDAPVITKVCIGYCGVAWIEWDQPATGGAAEDYQVRWDTSNTGSFSSFEPMGVATSAFIVLDDPSASYFFQIAAVNSYGSAASNIYPPGATGLSAKNNTKPNLPENVVATGGVNEIRLDWTAPTTFASPTSNITCSPSGSPPTNIPVGEFKGFTIARRLDSTVPTPSDYVYNAVTEFDPSQLPDPITFAANWIDDSSDGATLPMGPVNCYTYYYWLTTQEACTLGSENVGGNTALAESGGWTPVVTAAGASNDTPQAPGSLLVDETNSVCDDILVSGDGFCNVHLTWPKVLLDEQGDKISIADYTIYRQKYNRLTNAPIGTEESIPITFFSTPCTLPLDPTDVDCAAYDVDATNMIYAIRQDSRVDPAEIDPLAPGYEDVYYDYWVTAKQCASAESPDSPTTRYPCPFAITTVTPGMTGVIEGTGTLGSPWLIEPVSVFSITTDADMSAVQATVILPDSSRSPLTPSSQTLTSASWPWVDLGDGVIYTIEVVITDTGGCKKNFYYYVQETSSNCCLMPVNIDARLLLEDGPGQKTRIRLQNLCSETLTITNIRIAWDEDLLLGGGVDRLTAVAYPTALGTCPTILHTLNSGTTPVNSVPQAGSLATLAASASDNGVACGTAGSNDYEIEIRFNKAYDPLAPVVTQVCVTYTTASSPATLVQCQILPGVSTTAGTCDAP